MDSGRIWSLPRAKTASEAALCYGYEDDAQISSAQERLARNALRSACAQAAAKASTVDAAELPRGPSGPHLLEELLPQANHAPQTLVVGAGAAAEGERALHSVSKAWFLIELLLHVHLQAAIGKAVVGSRSRRSDAPIKRKGEP